MNRRGHRWALPCLALAVMHLSLPTSGSAQLADLMTALGNGGSWINLDIVDGEGTFTSAVVPTAGLAVDGCFQIWEGHSGTWAVKAQDTQGDSEIDVNTEPGEPVEFSYRAGFQAQLDVNIQWSEPRDTTLFMWVGLSAFTSGDRDVCQPPDS